MITIRKAYPTDAYTLIQIQNIVWKNEFYDVLPNGILAEMIRKNEQIVAHLKDQIEENNRIFVALDDERVVGYVFYAKTPNVVYNAAAEIRSIYILPEYQKKQIGKKLFQEVIKEIKKLGFSSLIVYCPIPSNCLSFFLKFGGEKRELAAKNMYGYHVVCDLLFFDLKNFGKEYVGNDWNQIYLKAQENLSLLNNINREVAVVMSSSSKMYLGLGIKNRVCPIESALSNLHIGGETEISKLLILDRRSKPVLPCGRCRDLLISLGQHKAEILFDFGTLKTMTMNELNPYYKDEEKA